MSVSQLEIVTVLPEKLYLYFNIIILICRCSPTKMLTFLQDSANPLGTNISCGCGSRGRAVLCQTWEPWFVSRLLQSYGHVSFSQTLNPKLPPVFQVSSVSVCVNTKRRKALWVPVWVETCRTFSTYWLKWILIFVADVCSMRCCL